MEFTRRNKPTTILLPLIFLAMGFLSCTLILKEHTVSTQQVMKELSLQELNKTTAGGVVKEGNPKSVEQDGVAAVEFDGAHDGLFLPENPAAHLWQFTVEVLFRPAAKAPHEQRFLHFGEAQGDRMLIETRVTEDDQWYLDAFIKSGESSATLIDPEKKHPTGVWYHVALVVDNGAMDTYVNGNHELSGKVVFTPFAGGTASIGVRMNKISWFKGAISKVRITPRCLRPNEFMKK